MDLREEVSQIRQAGMEKAAELWEMFETLPTPIAPVNIFKASSSIKCAEFLTRIRNHGLYRDIAILISEFTMDTLRIADGEGTGADRLEGFRAIELIEQQMPLTKEVFDDAAAYAQRQHVFDGLIVLAGVKMGKETETKEAIETLQTGVGRAMVTAMFKAALLEVAPDENLDND